MITILSALWPIFFLIVAGYFLERRGFPGPGFWPGAEKFNYFLLFPALLLNSLSAAPLDNPALPHLLVAVALVLGVLVTGLVVARKLRNWPAARFGVFLQGTVRFNTYLGLAVVGALYGSDGLRLAAVVLAVMVPTVNVLSVWALTSDGRASFRSLFLPIIRNPLILACVAGILLNLSGIHFRYGADNLVRLLASTSLPLGLLSVGAALKPAELQRELGALFANSLTRLAIVPCVALLCGYFLHLPPIERAILAVFFSLPTAPTAYVLTRQLNGDGHLMAGVITLQTLLSAASLMAVLLLLG